MPYQITSKCSGTDTLCQDACPYDCVNTVAASSINSHPHLEIDEEQCTDCGACAVVCRESAIIYDGSYMGLKPQPIPTSTPHATMTGSAGGWNGQEESAKSKLEVPEGFVVIDRKIQSWARLMGNSSN